MGFRPPVLLSEKPTEVSSSSPEARIFEICSLTVACLTSNNTSSLHIQSFSSFYHSILLFRHQFFKPGTLDNNKLVCAFPFLQHFIHPEQTRTLARHNNRVGGSISKRQPRRYLFSFIIYFRFHIISAINDSSSVEEYSKPFFVVRPYSLNKYKFFFALEQRT